MMRSLIVRSQEGTCATVELSEQPVTIGRAETCDIILRNDGEVSREHAHVWLDSAGQVLVADKGSKNGTRVDSGESFRNVVRRATRWIRIGEYALQITGEPPAQTVKSDVSFQPDVPSGPDNTRYFPSSRRLELSQQRLTLLMSLAERIGGAFERKQLLEQALDACCDALGFERGLVALKTARDEPELPVTRNIQRDETGAYKVSRTLINRALVHGERAVVNNPAVDLVDNLSESLVRFPICSALCVPILHREEILGVVYGDRVTRAATYTPEDVDFLAAIARQVGTGLANLRLLQEHVRSQRILQELERARAIQRGLLPACVLQTPCVTVAGHNEPSSAVGGDYFDYFALDEEQAGLVIADVTGHGLPAALVAANLQAAARVALTAKIPLGELAERLNQLVHNNTASNVFITAIVGRIDLARGRVEYVNAGHPAPLLLSGDHVQPEDDGMALPLGINPEESYETQQIELGADFDAILFYTDGLIEAADPEGHMLDRSKLKEALIGVPKRGAQPLVRAALDVVHEHLGRGKNLDDLTLLALHYHPGDSA